MFPEQPHCRRMGEEDGRQIRGIILPWHSVWWGRCPSLSFCLLPPGLPPDWGSPRPRKGESRKGHGLEVFWRCGHCGFFFFLIVSASLRGFPRLLKSTVPKLHSLAGAVLGGRTRVALGAGEGERVSVWGYFVSLLYSSISLCMVGSHREKRSLEEQSPEACDGC